MRRSIVAAIGLALALAAPAAAQEFSAERLSEGIRVLASDDFGGRYPGTEGEALTLGWLQAQYEAMGLEPGGPDGRWLQPVDLALYRPAWPAVAAWSGPEGAGGPLRPVYAINLRAASGDGAAEVAGAGLVFVGYGIHAPERGWDDYGSIDVAGKVVVALEGEPPGPVFNGDFPTVYDTDRYKAAEAFGRGAVGLLTLVLDPADSEGWLHRGHRMGATRGLYGEPGLEFTGEIPVDLGLAMGEAAGVDLFGALQTVDSGAFRAIELAGVTLDAQVGERIEILRTYNLLARIPGAERPDETIIYSAHWDHVGSRDHPDAAGDFIFNGAWDNASGTVAVVEMARAFARGPRPARSVVFAHMAAEEMGLLGAFWYAAHPVWPLETTVADLNIDMLPLSGPTRDLPIFGHGQTTLEDDLQALAEAQGRVVTDDGQPRQGFYYRSDHFPFAEAGVPALMPWHGVDLVEGGRAVGQPAYDAMFAARYHRRADEWRPDFDFRAAIQNLELLYALGSELANGDRWPGWKPGSEFAAARAASEAARQ